MYRSQGLTLQSAVIDLSTKQFAPGLAFVALSRVRTLDGLIIHSYFPYAHIYNPHVHAERIQEETRIRVLAENTIASYSNFIMIADPALS